MKFLMLFLSTFISSLSFCANILDQPKSLSDSIHELLEGSLYDSVAYKSFNYFVDKNQHIKIYKNGVVYDHLWNDLPSTKGYRYQEIKPIYNEEELLVFYYGALAFNEMANTAWNEGGEAHIIHYRDNAIYNSNSRRIAYDYAAYILSDLCLNYIDKEILFEKKHHIEESDEKLLQYHRMKIYCLSMLDKFIYRYKNAPGLLLNECGNKHIGIFVLAEKNKYHNREYTKTQKEYNRLLNKKKGLSSIDKIEQYLNKIEIAGNNREANIYIQQYMPYVIEQLDYICKSVPKNDNIFSFLRKLNVIIGYSNNSVRYLSNKQKRDSLISLNTTAMIKYDLATLSTLGSTKYPKLNVISWRTLQEKIQENSCCVQFFESTNGNDRWLYGYLFDKYSEFPEIIYCGHSYWAEKDAFDNIERTKYWDKYDNIFYVGLNSMDLMDSEHTYIKAHRMMALADILFDKSNYNEQFRNYIIGDIEYDSNSNFSKNKSLGDMDNSYSNFLNDSYIINYIDSILENNCYIYSKYDVNKKVFDVLSNKKANILHISAHGEYFKEQEIEDTKLSPDLSMIGTNTLKNIYLLLSGYNNNPNNKISAFDISKKDFSGIELVFLSTCHSNSGNSKSLKTSTLASAFKIAGAKNVIAFIGNANVEYSDLFTKSFYDLISKGKSYHDAFYISKANLQQKAHDVNNKVILYE